MKAKELIILSVFLLVNVPSFPVDSNFAGSLAVKRKSLEFSKDTAAVNLLARKGLKYLGSKGSGPEVKGYIDSALLMCDRKNLEIPAVVHLLKAQYDYSVGDLRSASEEAALSMKLSAGSNDYPILARTYMFLGAYYQRTGMYKESLEYFDNAISICEKEGIKGLISQIYLAKAYVYESLKDISGLRESLKEMISAGQKVNDIWSVVEAYYMLGTSYCGDSVNVPTRNFIKADSLLKKCLFYGREVKDSAWTAGALANSGWNFYLEKMYDSAVYYYEKSLKFSLLIMKHNPRSNYTTVNSYGNLGTIYRDLGKFNVALKYYDRAIHQTKGTEEMNSKNLWWIYSDMSKLYLTMGDTAKAYMAYVAFKKYWDIVRNMENTKGLADARLRYEADAHRKEVELLSLRLKNNRLLNYGLALFIVLSIAIGLLLLRGYNLKNKKRISDMNRKIAEVTQANLRQQMNPHFIFNTLNSIQYYMYQHDKLSTNNYLTKFSSLMRKVLDNSTHTSIPLSDELAALRLYLELECIRFKDKFDFDIRVDEEIDPLMYKIPTMLIQPYVENSITHGLMPLETKGSVSIDIRMNTNYLLCTIEDNGIGRKAAKERKLKREVNHNSLGTRITESRLDLVNALYGSDLKTVYTDLTSEEGEPSGTRVEIHIPIIS